MLEKIIILVLCRLIGDYVLQIGFIAKTKGKNWYHLFVHCALYIVPFYVMFSFVWQLIPLFVLHIIIDILKAKNIEITIYPRGRQTFVKVMPYWLDQVLHYLTCLLYLI